MRVDSISAQGGRKLKKVKKKSFKRLWFLGAAIFVVCVGFFYFGRLGANFIFQSIEPITLLRDGRFLVLFQNNAEIRSSGGFIGSYAIVDVRNLGIKNISFNTNIIALDRQFTDKNFVPAPEPLAKFLKGQSWELRDSNYDASFPDAAKDILNFYELETSDKVDGIIALNAKVMVDLLNLTGPINLDQYGLQVTADNFYDVAAYQVEKNYFDNPENWVINQPKTFLKDLYPAIVTRALNQKLALAKLLRGELKNKEIIFYFENPQKEQIAVQNNWAAKIPTKQELADLFESSRPADYLYINSNSYSGDKSSLKIKELIDYRVTKNKEGKLVANMKLTRVHGGSYVWPDGPNDTWTRVFVPEGSMLVSVQLNGQDISKDVTTGTEAEKTFFGYKEFTNPGQANILEFSYLLPIEIDSANDYHLLVQKQPGVTGNELQVFSFGQLLYNGVLDTDKKL